MIDKNSNLAIVREFWRAIAARDVDAYLRLFAEGAVSHDPVNKPAQKTESERRANMTAILGGFNSVTAALEYITACGDHTANKWKLVGTTPDGTKVVIEGIDVIRHADDGRIAEIWGYFDN